MELTKYQVEEIENQLQDNGLTYWDIRIEILDHLISLVEAKMQQGFSYKSALESSMLALNLEGNLEALHKSRLLKINTIIRGQYFRKMKDYLTNPLSITLILASVLSYFLLFKSVSFFIFKIVTAVLLFAPVVYGVFLYFKAFAKKQKSGYLMYSSFYIFFSFLMLNVFLQFFQPEGIFPVVKETQRLIWFLVTCVNSLCSFAAITNYIQIKRKIVGIENAIKTL